VLMKTGPSGAGFMDRPSEKTAEKNRGRIATAKRTELPGEVDSALLGLRSPRRKLATGRKKGTLNRKKVKRVSTVN